MQAALATRVINTQPFAYKTRVDVFADRNSIWNDVSHIAMALMCQLILVSASKRGPLYTNCQDVWLTRDTTLPIMSVCDCF